MKRNYKIHDKEILAIICMLEEWRHFLEGVRHSAEIWIDYKNLEYFMTAKKLNCHQAYWFLYLVRFDFSLVHHLEHSMGKPDALSRYSDYRDRSSDNENIILLCPKLLAVCALEEIELKGLEKDLLSEIWYGNQTGD